MKHLRFLAYLTMMVAGLNFGLASCDDEDEEVSTDKVEAEEVPDTKEGGIMVGESFYQYYACAVKEGKGQLTKTSIIIFAMSPYQGGRGEDYKTGFFIGIAAQKYGLTNDLEKASEYVDELSELRTLFDNWIVNSEASDTATTQIIEFMDSYVKK